MKSTTIVCLDLEGVLVPEIWIAVAERTGIAELRLTTRDIADYDVLMKKRLAILAAHGLTLGKIQEVVATLSPLEGAKEFLATLRAQFQVVILSDTFYELASPLMKQLDWPTLFCHRLEINEKNEVVGYQLRQVDQKRKSVEAFRQLNFKTIASGDSFNDISMLSSADAGIFFCPPDSIKAQYPQFKVTEDYDALLKEILAAEKAL
jgi:phosphoserine / homoserine phosphotransferase